MDCPQNNSDNLQFLTGPLFKVMRVTIINHYVEYPNLSPLLSECAKKLAFINKEISKKGKKNVYYHNIYKKVAEEYKSKYVNIKEFIDEINSNLPDGIKYSLNKKVFGVHRDAKEETKNLCKTLTLMFYGKIKMDISDVNVLFAMKNIKEIGRIIHNNKILTEKLKYEYSQYEKIKQKNSKDIEELKEQKMLVKEKYNNKLLHSMPFYKSFMEYIRHVIALYKKNVKSNYASHTIKSALNENFEYKCGHTEQYLLPNNDIQINCRIESFRINSNKSLDFLITDELIGNFNGSNYQIDVKYWYNDGKFKRSKNFFDMKLIYIDLPVE